MRNVLKKIGIVLIVITIIVFLPATLLWLSGDGAVYETTNINDYGKIRNNYDNDTPKEFIFSFFPAEIQDCFSNITYHYKAKKFDTYAYECYLEFTVDDSDTFDQIVQCYANPSQSVPFAYDNSFKDYTVSDYLCLQPIEDSQTAYPIEGAEFGKILYRQDDRRIIFIALGVYDGGGTTTAELGYFFAKFAIDPQELETHLNEPPYHFKGTKTD